MRALRRVVEGRRTGRSSCLLALADAQQRYKIPLELLENRCKGTEMDVSIQQVQTEGPVRGPVLSPDPG